MGVGAKKSISPARLYTRRRRVCCTARPAAGAATRRPLPTATPRYPPFNEGFPGVRLIHSEPPVYIITGFLEDEACEALIACASGGVLDEVPYETARSVLLDIHRLWPLALVVATGAAFEAWRSQAHGGGVWVAAALGAAGWAAAVAVAVAGVQAGAQRLVGRVFTGTKWAAGDMEEGHAAAPAVRCLVERSCRLLRTTPDRLEPPTVTRYLPGQYQRVHFDGRPAGDPDRLEDFMGRGGQRMAQVLVYLSTLSPAQGGATKFHHPALRACQAQPRRGDALVFFPAFADGGLDPRMAHSGEPVLSGVKWTINTWACQRVCGAAAAD